MVPGKGWETGAVEVEISDKMERDGFFFALEALQSFVVPGKE